MFVESEISSVDVKVFALNGVVVSVCDGQQRFVSVGKFFVGRSDEIGERIDEKMKVHVIKKVV